MTIERSAPPADFRAERRFWVSPLSVRILAVNALALVMLAGGVLYLDQFRARLIEQRADEMLTQARLMATALAEAPASDRPDEALTGQRTMHLARRFVTRSDPRLRLFDAAGHQVADSLALLGIPDPLHAPKRTSFGPVSAELLDKMIEEVGSFPELEPYAEAEGAAAARLPEAVAALAGRAGAKLRRRPDTIVVVNVAAPIVRGAKVVGLVMLTAGTGDITDVVRAERLVSFQIFLLVLALTLMISLFQARTIARPIRRLAIAAERVRQGRARDVTLPRFRNRRDEIGLLARALSDMTQALQARMDATEGFAADVAHELKNPLGSIRSAIDSIDRVSDAALQARLLAVIRDDVTRLDRLITDIADASRLDAEMSRARFEVIDLGEMATAVAELYRTAGMPRQVTLIDRRPPRGQACAMGAPLRLSQVLRNLIDNAVSFSGAGGVICLAVERADNRVRLTVDDDGPGIPAENIEDIFQRFYSERPGEEAFGQHSGLGLAISKQIVEAHGGRIFAQNRIEDGHVTGARFIIDLPAHD